MTRTFTITDESKFNSKGFCIRERVKTFYGHHNQAVAFAPTRQEAEKYVRETLKGEIVEPAIDSNQLGKPADEQL